MEKYKGYDLMLYYSAWAIYKDGEIVSTCRYGSAAAARRGVDLLIKTTAYNDLK